MAKKSSVKKIVLAYSGGLDTSIILKWLKNEYGCEVIAFSADLGQGDELDPVRDKAMATGADKVYIDDLKEEFVRDFVFPMFRANAIYEGHYLLGTSIARPLIAKRADGDRQKGGGRCRLPRRHRQGQRPGPLRAGLLPLRPGHQGHRPLARLGPEQPHRR